MNKLTTCLLLLPLAACMTTPPTATHQPMSVRPPVTDAQSSNGSIYHASKMRPLFDDRRARYVGDVLTVNLVERTSASKASNANATRSSEMTYGLPTMAGVPGKFLAGIDVSGSSDNSFTGKGAAAANNAFTGTITVTVIEVLANGNLVVSGEKQIAINKGEEFIRLSGVVNPNTVTTANTVQSTQVADARLEYRGSGYIDEAQNMGWLQRFFQNIAPF